MSPPMANLCCYGWIAEHFHLCLAASAFVLLPMFSDRDPDLGGHLERPKAFHGFQESHGRNKGFSNQRVSRTERKKTEPIIYATTVLQTLRRC